MDVVNNNQSPASFSEKESKALNMRFYQKQQDIEAHRIMVYEDTMLAIAKNTELSKLYERRIENVERIRADIATKKASQQAELLIDQSGKLILRRELFNNFVTKNLDVVFQDGALICSDDKLEDMKLVLHLKRDIDSNTTALVFLKNQLSDKELNRVFNGAGISFGFSHDLETMVRRLLVVKCAGSCEIKCVPSKRGWQKRGEELVYVGPREKIWKEY